MATTEIGMFGLTTPEDQLGLREKAIILNALNNQRRYCRQLAERNRDAEAKGRNMVNALEVEVLQEKLSRAWGVEP